MSAEHFNPELKRNLLRERAREILNQTPRLFSNKQLKKLLRSINTNMEKKET